MKLAGTTLPRNGSVRRRQSHLDFVCQLKISSLCPCVHEDKRTINRRLTVPTVSHRGPELWHWTTRQWGTYSCVALTPSIPSSCRRAQTATKDSVIVDVSRTKETREPHNSEEAIKQKQRHRGLPRDTAVQPREFTQRHWGSQWETSVLVAHVNLSFLNMMTMSVASRSTAEVTLCFHFILFIRFLLENHCGVLLPLPCLADSLDGRNSEPSYANLLGPANKKET